MRTHNVIIVTSGLTEKIEPTHLDQLIRSCLRLGKNPIIVVGPDGDELLRNCNEIESCDLVFDPNFTGEYFSSLKAGLHATRNGAYLLPVEAPCPPASEFAKLATAAITPLSRECDVMGLVTQSGKSDQPLGLQFVTNRGVARLKELPAETPWEPSEQIVFSTVENTLSSVEPESPSMA